MFKSMFKRLSQTAKKGQKGLTLIEFIVVISLMVVFLSVVGVLVTKGRQTAAHGTTAQNIDIITQGLAEYKMAKGVLPTAATPAWTGLTQYVPANLQASWTYICDAGNLTLTTPAYDDAASASASMQKFIDAGVCDSTSALSGNKIGCILSQYKGSAGC